MYESRVPVKGWVEVLGPYQLLVHLETKTLTQAGNPREIHETEAIDPVQAEEVRDRVCRLMGWACIEWTMPEEALKVNLQAVEMAVKTRHEKGRERAA